jgi:hypothetical protein
MRRRPSAQLHTRTTQTLKGEQPMNTNTATEYRNNLPLAVLTESATNPRRIFEAPTRIPAFVS